MAGGPSTPALVAAVGEAGGLGFLAGGYLDPVTLGEQVASTRALTAQPFGVNLFVPEPDRADPERLAAFSARLRPWRERLGVPEPEALPAWDDDHYGAKVEVLLADPVPAVSFTFGLPDAATVRALAQAGSSVLLSVSSVEEAVRAVALAPDALVVQGPGAGGHRATLSQEVEPDETPLDDLVRIIAGLGPTPVIAAGAVADASRVRDLLGAGAQAVQVGTAFLLATEAGTHPVHREALLAAATGRREADTVVTRAFSGRPARALANDFTRALDRDQVVAYPQVHHLTSALRAASRAAGEADGVNLWCGTGVAALAPGTAAEILDRLAP